MSINEHVIDFKTTPDFEFGKQHPRKCKYKIYNPEKEKGLVVYVPGFGGDLGSYTETFCQKVSDQWNLSTMSVEYFCMHCRPAVGAEILYEHTDVTHVNQLLTSMGGIPTNTIQEDVRNLCNLAEQKGRQLAIPASLRPPNGEYQNFGLLAALDIINAIRDAIVQFDLDRNNIYIIGSSYGGYLANLVTKFYPGLIKAVFDNSAWANPNLAYIVGRELNVPEFTMAISQNVTMSLHVSSPWTINTGLPNSFENEKYQIRAFGEDHIKQMADQGGKDTAYVFFHAMNDGIANTQEKIDMAQAMIRYGITNLQMTVMDKSDIDGKLIKSLDHGMGLSMLKFFAVAYEFVKNNFDVGFTSSNAELISYSSDNYEYTFDYSQTPLAAQVVKIT